MPFHNTIILNRDVPTMLGQSGVAISEVTFQNLGDELVKVFATVGENAPSLADFDRAFIYGTRQASEAVSLAKLFPGIPGANRLWGLAGLPTKVLVSHP